MHRIIFAIALSAFCLSTNASGEYKTSSHQVMIQSSINIEHSGRTDRDGCHRDRKTGTRHCH